MERKWLYNKFFASKFNEYANYYVLDILKSFNTVSVLLSGSGIIPNPFDSQIIEVEHR